MKDNMPESHENQMEFPWAGARESAPAPAPPVPVGAAQPRQLPATPAPAPAASEADAKAAAMRRAGQALLDDLTQGTGLAIRLHITNNSSTMMTVRKPPNGKSACVRLHHMFLDAPPEVRRALIEWVRKPKAPHASEVIGAFIETQRGKIRPKRRRTVWLRTRGRCFNLQRIFDEVNAAHFEGKITARITWGKLSAWPKRSIRYGSYVQEDNLIRIHPLLDQEFVPECVVRYVVFHEMLHALLGVEEGPDGRRRVHPPEFKRREAAYPDFARASAWCEDTRNFRRMSRLRR